MVKVIRRIYSLYVLLIFVVFFILLLPLFLLFILIDDKHPFLFTLNRIWAVIFFALIFMPVEVIYEEPLSKKGQYIFCANHFSYFDIPIFGYLNFKAAFVGKSSLARIPLFGFVFRKIHVTVDRQKMRGRYEALQKAVNVLNKGTSLIFFPEGGISSKNPPQMTSFKDGAFRAAIEKQIPIVPVTIPYNWIILPDDGKFLLKRRSIKIVIHKPVIVNNADENSVNFVKEETFRVINTELKKHYPEYIN